MDNKIDLKERFPNMKPMTGAPPLVMVEGCGTSVYGRRDYDAETKTYVKTYCLCFIFIPLVPLCAYRVADAGKGRWYFLGREPLSTFARGVNYALLVALLWGCGMSAWRSYVESPAHRASVALAQAEACENKGELLAAAGKYFEVARMSTPSADLALRKLIHLAEIVLARNPDADTVAIVRTAAAAPGLGAERSRLCQLVAARTTALADTQPQDALRLLAVLPALGFNAKQFVILKEQVQRKVLAQDPTNLDVAVALALLAEERKDFGECDKLLTPVRDKLGVTEGARMLGSIYASQDKPDAAFILLDPYVESKLKDLHQAEQAYEAAAKACNEQGLAFLRAGRAPQSFYQEWKALGEKQRQAKVDDYLAAQWNQDPRMRNCQSALQQAARVVPVAMELGGTRMQRAQAMTDPEARRRELGAAEKLFMSIQNIAGHQDQFRFCAGQVAYWLGKPMEGKQQFDDLLAAHQRDHKTLIAVAMLLREVGAVSEARALAEEAYQRAANVSEKSDAAMTRAHVSLDNDDQIKWLQLTDTTNPGPAGSLQQALGEKAMWDGDDPKAEKHLREALKNFLGVAQELRNSE